VKGQVGSSSKDTANCNLVVLAKFNVSTDNLIHRLYLQKEQNILELFA